MQSSNLKKKKNRHKHQHLPNPLEGGTTFCRLSTFPGKWSGNYATNYCILQICQIVQAPSQRRSIERVNPSSIRAHSRKGRWSNTTNLLCLQGTPGGTANATGVNGCPTMLWDLPRRTRKLEPLTGQLHNNFKKETFFLRQGSERLKQRWCKERSFWENWGNEGQNKRENKAQMI